MKNICIVGLGAISPLHIDAISKLSDYTKLYAVCDIVKEKADEISKKYSVKSFYNIDDALKDENVDSFHILTPHYLHFEMIKKCLEKGKMVVSEKPLVMTKEEFSNLSSMDTQNLCCIFQNRTNSTSMKLMEIIKSDSSIGEFKGSRAFLTWDRDRKYYESGEWRGKWATEGGGVLINQAIHTLDLMLEAAGKVSSVKATMANHSLKDVIEVEDTMEALIYFENGTKGLFYASNANGYHAPPMIEISFKNALFLISDGKLYRNGELLTKDSDEYAGKICWGDGHSVALHNIYAKNESLKIKDIKNTMHTVYAIYESAKQNGKEVLL